MLNDSIVRGNGNSYFADDTTELLEEIDRDISFFTNPGVEDIEVRIVWSQAVSESATFYPNRFYGETPGFRPMFNNSRPATLHRQGGMNYSEGRRYIHYVNIPPQTLLEERTDIEPHLSGDSLLVGTVYVSYAQEDIDFLDKYYQIVFDQAKSVNLLQ